MPTTRLKIAKLSAATDAAHIEKALEAVPRVRTVRVDAGENEALIDHEGAEADQFVAAVKQLGYIAALE